MGKETTSSIEPPFPREAIPELELKLGRQLDGWEAKAPAHVSPSPGQFVKHSYFDVDAVVHVVKQLRAMPHTEGRWRGTAFEPETWQIVWILAPVFGWKHPTGLRIINEVWDEIGRKNGKTSLATRLMLILLVGDGEYGAQVYAAAGSKEQAGYAFTPAKAVAESAPKLKGRLKVLTGVIRAPKLGGFFRVLSKAGDLAHGANVHGGLIDEIHVHKNRLVIDAIESGTGAREQPLIFYSTTANDGDDTTIYGELHGRAVKLAAGVMADPSTYIVIWCAAEDDDPFAIETIEKANPNYPISPTAAYIERKIRKAKDTPTWLPTYYRLHLNIRRTSAAQAWPGVEHWPAGGGIVPDEKLKGQKAWGGLVCASATDLTALCWCIRNPEGEGYWLRWRWFLPEESLPELDERTGNQATIWRQEKRIVVTDEGQVDLTAHVDQVMRDAKLMDVRKLAYDPNGSIGVITPIMETKAIDCVPVFATSPGSAMLDMERLLRASQPRRKAAQLNHGGDPIAAWQVRNLRVKDAATGVVKIDRRNSVDNVLGIAAAELALRMALMDVPEKPSNLVLTYR